MKPRGPAPGRLLAEAAVAAMVSVLLAIWLLQLWRADLRVPFHAHGDGVFFGMMVKALIEEGWYLTNRHLGAPFALTLHDFPLSEAFHLGVIKLMSLFSQDWALVFNLYFLLGFPAITLSALAVFRHSGVGYPLALAGGLLYAFCPNRLFTGEAHFFLTVFYQVPPAVLVALWVAGEAPPLATPLATPLGPARPTGRVRAWVSVGTCLVTAATGIYYAFFLGALILVGGALASLERRTWRNALSGLALTAVILAGLVAQGIPTFVFHARYGPNPQIAGRSVEESEMFGLRIARLLLPVDGHRIPALRRLKERSDLATALPPGEGASIGLGLAGSVGFLGLLGIMLVRPRGSANRNGGGAGADANAGAGAGAGVADGGGNRDRDGDGRLRTLSVLNLVAVLMASVGGFGYLFALLVTPKIRSYARINVIISFISLFALVLLLERLCRDRPRRAWVVAVGVAGVGLFDQVTPAAVRPYAAVAAEYRREAELVHRIESELPPESKVFELPYQRFPEGDPPVAPGMVDYDPLRPYLQSHALRWSYPAIYNRRADAWIRRIAGRPVAEMLEALSATGFAGIFIDRSGYLDHGQALEAALAATLGAPPELGPDRRYAFFSLLAFNARAGAGLSEAAREVRTERALEAVTWRWMSGFYRPERGPRGEFHWCTDDADVLLESSADGPRTVDLTMTLTAGSPPAQVTLEGDLVSGRFLIPEGNTGTRLSRRVVLSPGSHLLRFHVEGWPADAPSDPRRLMMRVDETSAELVRQPL
jgi:phosphoglycerol transferase